jgi:hypothetical protein
MADKLATTDPKGGALTDSDNDILSAIDAACDPAAQWVPASALRPLLDRPNEIPERLGRLKAEHLVQIRVSDGVEEVRRS